MNHIELAKEMPVPVARKPMFSLAPSNLTEAMEFANIMAKSSIVPKNFYNKPADILIAVQMGAEVGLKPIQALQNIAIINGKPSVYGDALLALVQANPAFEDIKEYYDEKLQGAVCTVKRKGQSEYTITYTIEDAKKAQLWGKSGPWQQYPKRMLQMRARSFALRDKFADVLSGLISTEEARDYKIIPNNSNNDEIIINDHSLIEHDNGLKDRLFTLINERNVPQELINKWCEKAEISDLEDLQEDQIVSCINYIETRYEAEAV